MVDVSSLSANQGINNASTGSSKTSMSALGDTFDSFLILLTQQMKNQDPLKPMDATQFTTQLVQFTQVEQQIRQNQNLEAMIVLQHSTLVSSMTSYLGKTVDTKGESVYLTESGNADISYTLPEGVATVEMSILDSTGNVLRKVTLDKTTETSKGAHVYSWDGKNTGGIRMTEGSYSVQFRALDTAGNAAKSANGVPVTVSTTSSGKVTNVGIVDGQIILTVGGAKIPLAEVGSIRETTTATN
jgi:flagellar basal-body rod modification protein FlgD